MTQSVPPPELAGNAFEEPSGFKPSRRKLAISTLFFSFATTLSRIGGLIREVFAASYFGVSGPVSAFTIAFQVPNLLRSLVADAALQAAFVPVFTEMLERGKRRDAFTLASTLFFLIVLLLGAVTALFVLLAPVVMPLFMPGFDAELRQLTIHLSQLLFPIVLLLGLSGLVVGVLNSFDHFSVPAIAPLFWNLVIIAALIGLTPLFDGQDRIYAYAIGVLAGTVVQLLLPLPMLRRYGFKFVRSFNWRDPRVRRIAKLMLPVTVGLGLINFNLSVDSFFATLISDQAPAAIDKAFRVYMLPQGIFSVAVATVLFPTFSRFVAGGDHAGLARILANGTRQLLLLMVPAAVAIFIFNEEITRLLYQRGEFDASQTKLVADGLKFFALSLPFAGINLLFTRAFFSLQRPWIPTLIAMANLVVNAGLDAILYGPMGIAGIVLATAFVSAVTTFLLAYVLRGKLGHIHALQTLSVAVRVVIAAALFGIAALVLHSLLEGALFSGFLDQLVTLTVALVGGGVVYVVTAAALRVPELKQISREIAARLK